MNEAPTTTGKARRGGKTLDAVARGVTMIPMALVGFGLAMILIVPFWAIFNLPDGRGWILFGCIYGPIAFAPIFLWAERRSRPRP